MPDLIPFTQQAADFVAAAPSRAELFILCGIAFVVLRRHDVRIATVDRRLARLLSLMSGAVQGTRRVDPVALAAPIAIGLADEATQSTAPLRPTAPMPVPSRPEASRTLSPARSFEDRLAAATARDRPKPPAGRVPDIEQHTPAAPTALDVPADDGGDIAGDASDPTQDRAKAPSHQQAAEVEPARKISQATRPSAPPEPESPMAVAKPAETVRGVPDAAIAESYVVDVLGQPLGGPTPQRASPHAEAYQASLMARIKHEQRLHALLEQRTASLARLTVLDSQTVDDAQDAQDTEEADALWSAPLGAPRRTPATA